MFVPILRVNTLSNNGQNAIICTQVQKEQFLCLFYFRFTVLILVSCQSDSAYAGSRDPSVSRSANYIAVIEKVFPSFMSSLFPRATFKDFVCLKSITSEEPLKHSINDLSGNIVFYLLTAYTPISA